MYQGGHNAVTVTRDIQLQIYLHPILRGQIDGISDFRRERGLSKSRILIIYSSKYPYLIFQKKELCIYQLHFLKGVF